MSLSPEILQETQNLLRTRFKLETFRKGQLEIITSVLEGRDALAVMPTGGGKSLCYQLPALFRPGTVVVISPLIALMKDQVRLMRKLGIPAGCLYSDQNLLEKQKVFHDLNRSPNFILYLSPERVQKPGFASWIKERPISLFAIDESHCISQWGHDFRKDYHRLTLLRELRPQVPILALTATATPMVLRDIGRRLGLKSPDSHVHGFYRPNLYYQVEHCEGEAQKLSLLTEAIRRTPEGRVLVYCGTRKQTEAVAGELQNSFSGVGFYNAGIAQDDRTRIQHQYEQNELRILTATNAFGMGIDHPDVRLVSHFQMPANLESFYQEMGRAGRDGRDSTCLLLYARADRGLHAYFIAQADPEAENINQRWRALETITQFAEGGECRHAGILTYFRDAQRIDSCGHCDICAPQSDRRIVAEARETPKVKRRRARQVPEGPLSPEAEVRWEMLKDWRKRYAEENDIPAFLVFSNKTLRELAQHAPETLEALEGIHGFGPHKLEHLGPLVLAELERC